MMDNLDLIAIGEIVKAHGVRGELKVVPLTDAISRFGEVKRVYWKKNDFINELFIEGYRSFKGGILLKLKGIDTLTAAEDLGRGLLYIPRKERPKLPKGRYYHDEICGLNVYTLEGEFIGIIKEIIQTGSNDVYVVADKTEQILIPALKTVIQEINLADKRMSVLLPPGLVDD